jgi:hypothetical protein
LFKVLFGFADFSCFSWTFLYFVNIHEGFRRFFMFYSVFRIFVKKQVFSWWFFILFYYDRKTGCVCFRFFIKNINFIYLFKKSLFLIYFCLFQIFFNIIFVKKSFFLQNEIVFLKIYFHHLGMFSHQNIFVKKIDFYDCK